MGDSYFWKPFAQGVATPVVLIGGTNLLLKDFKVSNPYLYWGGLAASSAVVVGILADKIKVPILNAETYSDGMFAADENCYCNGEGTMGCGGDWCCICGADWKDSHDSDCEMAAESFEARTHRKSYDWDNRKFVKRPDGKHNPGQLRGYDHSPRGTPDSKLDWDSANMANTKIKANLQGKEDLRDSKKNAETFGKRDSANMRELRKILEGELPILVQQINKIEKQLKSLERGIPIEYPIENIRDNLDNMTEVIGRIHLQKIDYLSHYEAETFEAKVYDPMMQKKIDKNECKHRYDDGEDAWVMKYSELMGVEDGLSYVEAGVKCEICAQERIGSWGINEKEGFEIVKGEEGRMPKMYGFYYAETFNSDSHTDSFMADMPVNAVKNEHGEGWTIDSVHRRDYKETFKNWKPSKYPYEKRITQDSVNEACNSCGKKNVHYQFYLPQKNSVNPKMRFIDSATYCQYDPNTCGGNICRDCADNNDSCENCGAEICEFCRVENNYDHSDLVCVDCREFNESLEDD